MGKETQHLFLDEAGDTTFFGKYKADIVGKEGVSRFFILGMVHFHEPVGPIRENIIALQQGVIADPYFKDIPSIQKKKNKGGFYFHACDDIPEVRKLFFDYIRTVDCKFEAVAGRKTTEIYEKKHHGNEDEFYADLLSHLLNNLLVEDKRLVINVAERGKSTRNANLEKAITKAEARHSLKQEPGGIKTAVAFNVQNHLTEPVLNIADYFCWAVQRFFERGEKRYFSFIEDKIAIVLDLYRGDKKTV
jgi:hypothetical protein